MFSYDKVSDQYSCLGCVATVVQYSTFPFIFVFTIIIPFDRVGELKEYVAKALVDRHNIFPSLVRGREREKKDYRERERKTEKQREKEKERERQICVIFYSGGGFFYNTIPMRVP